MKTVYLAGPILDCTDGEANDWRRRVAAVLKEDHDIRGVSPLRCEPLIGERYSMDYPDPKFGTPKAIASKNVFDVKSCDMTLAYLPRNPYPEDDAVYAKDRAVWHQSYGTIAELAGAFFIGKPAVLVSDDPGVYNHPVLSGLAGWVLPTLDDAIEVIGGVLGGYTPGGKYV